ncbi:MULTISPECIES: hypothetical protein [Streptacidiphilus]|uniref:DUF4395 domain-containing protein n=1 Tax=Streptacidiphilus cavernicola TaxID=3342716 RepID=A0ABV6UWM3_9ACTN|nr:hypothetical protein [Streptacidiphilus jeojiense]
MKGRPVAAAAHHLITSPAVVVGLFCVAGFAAVARQWWIAALFGALSVALFVEIDRAERGGRLYYTGCPLCARTLRKENRR